MGAMSAKTLVVLAAGMGSRYGGLKQMDPVGPNGETTVSYTHLANQQEFYCAAQCRAEHFSSLRTEGHANADLAQTSADRARGEAKDSRDGQNGAHDAKHPQRHSGHTGWNQCPAQLVGPGKEFERQASILFAEGGANVGGELLGIAIGAHHDG